VFRGHPISVVTHGERLAEKAAEVIGRCTTVTVSIIPKDPDREIQMASIKEFLAKKGDRAPMFQLKFVGHIENAAEYEALGVPIINRALHVKPGNWSYVRTEPPVPESRLCQDFLGRPTVDWRGRLFICNRLDVKDEGLLGDLNESSLSELWNGQARMAMLAAHLAGRRDQANSLCARCSYWGIPTPAG
jgi:radical SAM protein with 4Fe4S-binding SPASM domain